MPTVTFHSFKNGRTSFAEVMPSVTTDQIARIAKRKGKLASRGVDAFYLEPKKGEAQSHEGIITAGDRVAARFTVAQ